MTDYTEIVFVLCLFNYLMHNAPDWLLTTAIVFSLWCGINFLRSMYKMARLKSEASKKWQGYKNVPEEEKTQNQKDLEELIKRYDVQRGGSWAEPNDD